MGSVLLAPVLFLLTCLSLLSADLWPTGPGAAFSDTSGIWCCYSEGGGLLGHFPSGLLREQSSALPGDSEPAGVGSLGLPYLACELLLRKLSHAETEPDGYLSRAFHQVVSALADMGGHPVFALPLIMFFLPYLPEAPEPLGGVHCAEQGDPPPCSASVF